MYYRHGIWHIDLNHKTNTRQQLFWMVIYKYLGWSPTNPRMEKVHYRLGIWCCNLSHKTNTRWELPWMVNGQPLFPGGLSLFPGQSPTFSDGQLDLEFDSSATQFVVYPKMSTIYSKNVRKQCLHSSTFSMPVSMFIMYLFVPPGQLVILLFSNMLSKYTPWKILMTHNHFTKLINIFSFNLEYINVSFNKVRFNNVNQNQSKCW